MNLQQEDLTAIRDLFNEAFEVVVEPQFEYLGTRMSAQTLKIQALKNELGDMNGKIDAGLFFRWADYRKNH